jgi:histidine ammonia-lyase
MGGWAVRKLREICRNTGYVLAIELLCAAQALDFCEIDPDSNIAKIHRLVRLRVSYLDSDRILAKDIETIFEFIYSGEFLKEVEVIMGGRSE